MRVPSRLTSSHRPCMYPSFWNKPKTVGISLAFGAVRSSYRMPTSSSRWYPTSWQKLSETSTYLLSLSTTVTYSSSYAKRVRLRIGSTFGRFGFTALRTKWDTLSPSREEAHVHEPYGVVGEGRRLLFVGQLREFVDGCLVVINPGDHHIRGSFGTQAISELAGAFLLAGLRPPKLGPDARRLPGCFAIVFPEHCIPLTVLQGHKVLAYDLRLDGVSHYNLLVAVLDEHIGFFRHPRTLLLVKLRQVTRLRQGASRFLYLGDDLLSGCLVLAHGDIGQGNDQESHCQNDEDFAVFHAHAPSQFYGECPICPKGFASIHPIAPARYSEIIFNGMPLNVRGYRPGGFMNILAALRKAEAKLQKQADKVRQKLDAVRAATKILGREVAKGGKRVGRKKLKKRVMSAAGRARIGKTTKARWAKFRAAKAKGKH